MNSLTKTFGCLEKDTVLNINGELVEIEDLWNQYKTEVIKDEMISEIETTIPNQELKTISFDGKNFVDNKIKRIIRNNAYNCFTGVRLSNGMNIRFTNGYKMLTDKDWVDSVSIRSSIAVPKKFEKYYENDYVGSFTGVTDGNLLFLNVVGMEYEIVDDYVYSIELYDHHNFLAGGIVYGDFIMNNPIVINECEGV